VVNLSNGFIASSSEAKRAFIRYGAQINSILIEPMPTDVQFFYHKTQSFRNSEQYKIMSAHYSHPLLLSIGRLVPQKGYLELFKIFEQVVSCHPTASLVIIGDGPYRQEFEHHVQIQKLKNVHFVGFVQPYDLPKYFSIADIFVFTTHQDRYGAVILEAMAAKVPVVASIYAAATEDLVIEGITGYRIDPFDILGSTEKICQVINLSAEARTRLVNAAYDKAEPLDAGHSAVRIFNFVNDLHNNYASHTYRSQGLNVL
jgi:glycosyltransferase involved in cell wall biosynthesis